MLGGGTRAGTAAEVADQEDDGYDQQPQKRIMLKIPRPYPHPLM